MRVYCFLPALCLAVSVSIGRAQETNAPASAAQLAEISAGGRALAEYDTAAWRATDAVAAKSDDNERVRRYLARKTDSGWTVVFGKLNDAQSAFLIAYEARAAKAAGPYRVVTNDPPEEDREYFARAARATDLAFAQFGIPSRPYNVAAIPASQGQWWVYLVPAPTQVGVWPLGGDMRYRINGDGMQVLSSNRLHYAILEERWTSEKGKTPEAGAHTVLTAEHPWETDVFHVLVRSPRLPEYVSTKHFLYLIETNGAIQYVQELKEKTSEKHR